jgi:orotidine 5'-phosphate decarboxylase subfamily 1
MAEKVLESRAAAADTKNALAARVWRTMAAKKSNLCVAADVTTSEELLKVARECGKAAAVLKVHADIVDDFSSSTGAALVALAAELNFVLFADRKFADIGKTVSRQFHGGPCGISSWAELVSVTPTPGPAVLEGLRRKEGGAVLAGETGAAGDSKSAKQHGALVVAEMDTPGSLACGHFTDGAVKLARGNADFAVGFMCQKRLVPADDELGWMLHFCPGVKMEHLHGEKHGDAPHPELDNTPEAAVARGVDLIVVGRGICACHDLAEESEKYRAAGWAAFEKSLE